jgi:hypothetical protein
MHGIMQPITSQYPKHPLLPSGTSESPARSSPPFARWTHVPSAAAFQTQACCCLRDACIPYAWLKEEAACIARQIRAELESHVSSAGRAVYHPNVKVGSMFLHTWQARTIARAGARLKLHGARSFASRGSLPSDHRACEVECEG